MFERCFASIDIPNKAEHMRLFEKEVFKAAKNNPNMSSEQVIQEAMKSYSVSQRQALKAKQLRSVRSGIAMDRLSKYIDEQAKTIGSKNEAIARKLVTRRDGRSLETSVEAKSKGIFALHASEVVYKLAQELNTKALGWGIDKAKELDFLKGLRGESNNPLAKAVQEKFTYFRDRAVSAGNDIGLLTNWGNPQAWDAHALLGRKLIGNDIAARKKEFVDDFVKHADIDAYSEHLGKVPTTEELRKYIEEAFTTIITDGKSKEKTAGGGAGVSRLMSAERQLFIKGGEGFQFLNDKYGAKSTLELINGHFNSLSKLIAFTEEFGPNGDRVIEELVRKNIQESAKSGGNYGKEERIGNLVLAEMRSSLGQQKIEDLKLHRAFSAIRNLQVLKLGAASISSFADNGNIISAAVFGEGSAMRFYQNRMKQITNPKATKFAAVQAGIAADVIYHHAYNSMSDMLQKGWTGAAASATNTLSLLNLLTRTRKEAFREMRLHALTEVFRGSESFPTDINGKIMRGHGITDADYKVMRDVALTKPEGETLTPADVLAAGHADVAERMSGMTILDTASGVVEQSGWARMVSARGKLQKGTWAGELVESFWMFKGYPINAMYRVIDGYRLRGGVNGTAYAAFTMMMTTLFGAAALQFSELKSGKEARSMNDSRFWIASMMKGGSLGIFGDFLYTKSRFGKSAAESFLGPALGDVISLTGIAADSLRAAGLMAIGDEEAQKEAKDAGGNLLRLVRTNTPLLGLWYLSAAVDHEFTYQAQDLLSPGYTRRMQQRTQKEFGQRWWWKPSDRLPEKIPDALGGE